MQLHVGPQSVQTSWRNQENDPRFAISVAALCRLPEGADVTTEHARDLHALQRLRRDDT